jgi:hypothetical protein
MQQLIRSLLLVAVVVPMLVACGSKEAEATPAGGESKRLSLEEAEKMRPKKKGDEGKE